MANQSQDAVLNSLKQFLGRHNLQDYVSDIDDIVLNYLLSILEELGDGTNGADEMDVDEFIEMMDAYIPGFATIDSVTVCEWMFDLAQQLSQSSSDSLKECQSDEPEAEEEEIAGAAYIGHPAQPRDHLDSVGDSRKSSESSTDEVDEQLETLLEMFPQTLRVEAEYCLRGSDGDLERAVQLILHRDEAGQAITQEPVPKTKQSKCSVLDTEAVDKKRLMARYAYIDVSDDKKSYKPAAPKTEAKKMVRYLDSQVVNTKGNRYTEVKKENTDEMKKTYINLKPARKYRFH